MAGEKVALIGVGKMGRALLARLLAAGHAVRVFDLSDSALRVAREQGAEPAATPRDAARGCAFIHVFLATDDQVGTVMTGSDGVFAGTAPGGFVLLHSTIHPATTRRLAGLAPAGVSLLDAPVASKPDVLAAGEGMFLVGGSDTAFAAIESHLAPLAKAAYHLGPLGAGNIAKIARNLSNLVERVTAAETARLVEAAGLDIAQFLEMATRASRAGLWREWPRMLRLEQGHAVPTRVSGLASKDMPHALALAEELGLDLPVARAAAGTASAWLAAWEAEPAKSADD